MITLENNASDGLTPLERKNCLYQERKILSMLRKHAGPMRQGRLVGVLTGESEDLLAGVILKTENKRFIKRGWKSDLGTLLLCTPFQKAVNG